MLKQAKLNKISTALRHNKMAKGAAAIAAVASLFGAPAYAEEAATAAESDVEVIEVKGIRGTVTRSINEKRNTASIVDAIAAADFGELPGLSISDIIENIPGAAGIRLKGSQNEISIRGLGSNFGYATFNGRTITNGTGARATNFKKFPSDLVDKVVVYKTQQADLVEGGTSGTIEISSLRAVDYGKNQTVVELQGIYNDQYSNVESPGVTPWGNKVVFSTIQSFETDNFGDFGFTLGYVESNDSNPEEFFNGSSRAGVCALRDSNGNDLSDNGGDCSRGVDGGGVSDQAISSGEIGRRTQVGDTPLENFDQDSIFFVPETAAFRAVADTDTRQNTVLTFQWVPNDQWDINLDYEYSKLQVEEQRYEVGIDNRLTSLRNHVIADDRTLAFVEGTSRIDFQGEFRTQLDTYEGGGIEISYNPNDALTLSADLSYSDSFRNRVRQRNNIRTGDQFDYTFDARDSTVPDVRFFNRTDGSEVNLSDVSSFVGADASAPRIEFSRDNDRREDDIWAIRFDADYALDHDIFSSVGVGVRYSREHLLDFQDNQVSLELDGTEDDGSRQFDASGSGDISREELDSLGQSIADNCQVQYDNSELFQDGGGLGQTFAAIDSRCQIGEILDIIDTTARRDLVGNNDTEGFFDIGEREDGRSGDDVDVREDILAFYGIAHIDTELNDKPLSGNVGFRVVKTQVASVGFGDALSVTSNPTVDTVTGETLNTFIYDVSTNENVNLRSDTTFFLPSFNLTYGVSDTFQFKAAASKSISRFRLDAFSSGISIDECDDEDSTTGCNPDTNEDINEAIQSVDANGNHLDPFVSNNFDLSFEWYPSADSAVTLGLYWKNFTGGSSLVTEQRDIEILLDGESTVIENVDVSVNQTDDNSSTIKGFEFVVNQNFSSLPAPFNGLGVNVAWNHAVSDFVTPEVASPGVVDDANLFGFSEDVVSSSLYWEGDKLSLRLLYKYRSSFFQPNNLPFPDRSARFTQSTEYVDFSSRYKLTKNVSLSFKVLNIFDEPQVQTRSNDSTASDISRTGRKFFLSAKVKF